MMGSFSGNMSINHSNVWCFVSTCNTFMGKGHLGMFMIMTVDMPSHFKSDDFKIVGSLNFITTIGKRASIMSWMSGIKMLFQIFRTLKFLFTNMASQICSGVRPDVRASRVSSVAPKRKSFDRGGPVWPPRSNVTNDRLRAGFAPPAKNRGSGGQCAPPPKPKNI